MQTPLGCTTSRPSSSTLRGVAGQIVNLINQQRVRYRVRPLGSDSRITTAAVGHSLDMARTGIFSHVIDGKGPPDRLRAQGLTFTKWGENIYYDNSCRTPSGPSWNAAAFAQEAVTGWMASPGHRRNILDPDFNYAGVGVAAGTKDGTGWLYATRDFIQR
jgi:uncharacterized protein YkwD